MTSNLIIAFLRQNTVLNTKSIERELNLPKNCLGVSLQKNGRPIPEKHIPKLTEYLKQYGLETFVNSKIKTK